MCAEMTKMRDHVAAEQSARGSERSRTRALGPGRKEAVIAAFTAAMIVIHLTLRFAAIGSIEVRGVALHQIPLIAVLTCGGGLLVLDLITKLLHGEFGLDLLAAISIVTSALLGEYLVGALVVLMLSGGQTLEAYAVRSASSVLEALARRVPSSAHRSKNGQVADIPLAQVAVGDTLVVFPHEICPVDGTVLEGHGVMDESYLTGEPYLMSKIPGSVVLSGAINAETALTIRADKLAVDSRYAKIMSVMRASEQRRPRLRRIGDQLGAYFTPFAVLIALAAWLAPPSGNIVRFLAVLVSATPCPLLIAIPVAIIGAISLSARRGIIIKDPAVLEKIALCRTAIFDKTGTLTYGQPKLTALVPAPGFTQDEVLALVASLERYSKHPLAGAIVEAARAKSMPLMEATQICEPPGQGLRGTVAGHVVQITSRSKLIAQKPSLEREIPPFQAGMECVIAVDETYAATLRFRDQPRTEGASFVRHLGPKHFFERIMIVSGDRESEVRYLAEQVGITEVHASQTPEQKLAIVRRETQRASTVFLGDGINDAPALTAATVGLAFGQNSDITAEAAGAVILDTSLEKVDELLHVSYHLRRILLQSAIGGIVFSLVAMGFAAVGYLPPVAGALAQEGIDVFAVLNALRVAFPPKRLTDY
jgi:heavy metal translocating P-type ATPase